MQITLELPEDIIYGLESKWTDLPRAALECLNQHVIDTVCSRLIPAVALPGEKNALAFHRESYDAVSGHNRPANVDPRSRSTIFEGHAMPSLRRRTGRQRPAETAKLEGQVVHVVSERPRSEEHTSELQSLRH